MFTASKCEPLNTIVNGRFEITPFNTFGAKVRYTCNEGHILTGQAERVCQGDGFWSGEAPTCDTEGKPKRVTLKVNLNVWHRKLT